MAQLLVAQLLLAELTQREAEQRMKESIGSWDIEAVRCDNLLNVYAVSARIRLGSTYKDPTVNVVYLIWVDRFGSKRSEVIIKPKQIQDYWGTHRTASVEMKDGKILVSYGDYERGRAHLNNITGEMTIADMNLTDKLDRPRL